MGEGPGSDECGDSQVIKRIPDNIEAGMDRCSSDDSNNSLYGDKIKT